MPRPVTIEKLSEVTGITVTAWRRKIDRGEVPYYLPFGGRRIIFDLDEICPILLVNRVASASDLQEKAAEMLNCKAAKKGRAG